MIKWLIVESDLLGYQAKLQMKSQDRYKTCFGGIITIVVYLMIAAAFLYFGWQMFNKTQHSLIISRASYKDFGPYNFSSQEIGFYIGIEFSNQSYYIDPTIYSLYATQSLVQYVTDSSGNVIQTFQNTNLTVGVCTDYYTQADIPETNYIIPLDQMHCLEPNTGKLSGYWGSNVFNGMAIYVEKCINTTANNNFCRPIEEIDSYVQGGYFSVYYSSYFVTSENYTNPLQRELIQTFNTLNVDLSLELNYNVLPLPLTSDNGVFFPVLTDYMGFEWMMDFFIHAGRSNNILKFGFGGWSTGTLYIRTYEKIQDVLAKGSGVVKLLTVVGSLLVHFISKTYYYIDMLEDNTHLRNYAPTQHQSNVSQSELILNFKSNFVSSVVVPVVHNRNFNKITQKDSRDEKEDGKHDSQFSLLCQLLICKGQSKRSAKVTTIEKYEELSKKCLNAEFIVKKLFEFEISKKVLFKENAHWNTIFRSIIENPEFKPNADKNLDLINNFSQEYLNKLINYSN